MSSSAASKAIDDIVRSNLDPRKGKNQHEMSKFAQNMEEDTRKKFEGNLEFYR